MPTDTHPHESAINDHRNGFVHNIYYIVMDGIPNEQYRYRTIDLAQRLDEIYYLKPKPCIIS